MLRNNEFKETDIKTRTFVNLKLVKKLYIDIFI